jgi:hypothetical protein
VLDSFEVFESKGRTEVEIPSILTQSVPSDALNLYEITGSNKI